MNHIYAAAPKVVLTTSGRIDIDVCVVTFACVRTCVTSFYGANMSYDLLRFDLLTLDEERRRRLISQGNFQIH